jgi:hypothetical protein
VQHNERNIDQRAMKETDKILWRYGYTSQIWLQQKKQEAKIETAEMKILRNVAGPDKENKN